MSLARILLAAVAVAAPASAYFSPVLPNRPDIPEKAYNDCSNNFQQVRGIRSKIATLRHCQGQIEHFKKTYLQSYSTGLARYRGKLAVYRQQIVTSDMTAAEKRAAISRYEAEMESLAPGGELADAKARMTDRAQRDLAFVTAQICRLGRRRGSSCR